MNHSKPDDVDPDSKDHIDQGLRDNGNADSIGDLIERLGGKLPTVDLRAHAANDEPAPIETHPDAGITPRRGNFHVLGELARGGMGVVLRGHEIDLRRDVAIKVLQKRFAANPEVLARFIEEAQIGGQLQHPGIVPVYEIGVMADQRPYFTMKLVKGQTLAARLTERANTVADFRQLLDVFQAVCLTMAYAHSRRVIHRDLKPANVMVGAFGEVQVVDWGLAKVLSSGGGADEARASQRLGTQVSIIETLRSEPGSAGASMAGSVLGTPAYMPPEQARGAIDQLDERSDVFSLGAMLCELLTGAPPYGPDFREALTQAATGDLTAAMQRLDQCGADAPLVALCKQCLAPAPAARPADAGVLAKALQAYLASVEQRALDARLAAVAATTRAEAARRTRNLTVALALTGVLAVGLGGAGYAWLRAERDQRLLAAVERANAAMAEAALLRGQQRWPEAAAAARRSAELLPDDAPVALVAAARKEQAELETLARADREAAALAADNARLLGELRSIAEPDGGQYAPTDWTRVDGQFAAVFRAHGLAVDDASPAAAEALAARGIRVPLAESLGEWAAVRRAKRDRDGAERLLRAAMRLDPDPDRVALRNAVLAGNAEAVVALAKAPTALAMPSATLVEMVRALRAVGRSSDAIDAQVAACLRHPEDPLLAFEVAAALRQVGRGQESVRLLHAALAAQPASLPVRRSLACVLEVDLQEYRAAEQFVRESLRVFPDDAYLHLRLGQCLLAQERYDPLGLPISRQPETPQKAAALAELRTAIRLGPHADYHQVLGSTLLGLGRFADAAAAAREGLAMAERSQSGATTRSALHYVLSIACERMGDDQEAEKAMRSAATLLPDDALAVCGYARLQAKTDVALALRTVQEFLAKKPQDAAALSALATLLAKDGQAPAALAAARRAAESDPRDVAYWVALAMLTIEHGQVAEALTACEQGLELHPRSWELWDLLGMQLRAAGRDAELRERFQALARRDPSNPVAPARLGEQHMKEGEPALAVPLLRQSVRLGLRSPGAYTNLADALLASEGPAAALPVRDEAIASWPEMAALYVHRARDYAQLRRLAEALADAETAVRLAPGRAFPLEALAAIQFEDGAYAAAAATARAALRAATAPPLELELPGDRSFAFAFGTELIPVRPADAAELLRVATERAPGLAEAWCNLGHALAGAGRHADALAALAKGHALGAASPRWEYPSAEWVERARFFAEAEARWLAWLAEGKQPDETQERLGMMKWALARGEAAAALRLGDTLLAPEGLVPAETGIHADASKAAMLLANAATDAAARATLHRRARAELGQHVEGMRSLAAQDPSAGPPLAMNLRGILADEAYAPVREPGGVDQLPAADAAAWRQQWAALQQLAAALAAQ
ncbi:MAG: protein kinase [Planctomycetes bacterium]|nr:protein kinase [Planctomycetota bacterium]